MYLRNKIFKVTVKTRTNIPMLDEYLGLKKLKKNEYCHLENQK